MQLTMARTRGLRPILAVVMLVLLTVALVATALVIGSQRREPPPFGPARNGAIVYHQDGDLFIADQLGGTPRPLVAGSETDSDPVFSPQGDRVAFIRDGARIMTVSLDGSDVRELAMPGTVVRLDWSPDGSALLASTFSSEDHQALTVVQSDGSGFQTLDLQDIYAVSGSWRPDGRQIALVGYQAGALAAFIADADGTNVRPLVGPDDSSDGPGDWSPNGKQLSFLSSGGISIADIAEDGAMTDVRQLGLDLDARTGPDPPKAPRLIPSGRRTAASSRSCSLRSRTEGEGRRPRTGAGTRAEWGSPTPTDPASGSSGRRAASLTSPGHRMVGH